MVVDDSPQGLGFRMPAEWEPHEATWLVWPQNRNDWPGRFAPIPWVYTEIIRHLHQRERVRLIVADGRVEQRARRMLGQVGKIDLSRVEFHRFPTDRSWVRDSGPIFVKNRTRVAATCWRFNAWARYRNWKKDARVAKSIARAAKSRVWEPRLTERRIVLEGGSIDVNGQGALLTTEECLLGDVQRRNPGMEREDWEQVFLRYLGVSKVLWLGRGIAGDDTHGHVDDLARFAGTRKVVAAVEHDPSDVNYQPLQRNVRRLRALTDQDGQALEVVELPMPRPLYFRGHRLPASYANFYIANGAVLVPTFNDPNDQRALGTLASLFPDREVVGIHSLDLIWGFGALHCVTQQQPATK